MCVTLSGGLWACFSSHLALAEVLADGLPQLVETGHARVLGVAVLERRVRRREHLGRGREVWLADGEHDERRSLPLELDGEIGDPHGHRGRHRRDRAREGELPLPTATGFGGREQLRPERFECARELESKT